MAGVSEDLPIGASNAVTRIHRPTPGALKAKHLVDSSRRSLLRTNFAAAPRFWGQTTSGRPAPSDVADDWQGAVQRNARVREAARSPPSDRVRATNNPRHAART